MFGEKDQDEASVALVQSQQKAFTLGKTALRVEGRHPLCNLFCRESSQGVLSLLREAPIDQEVLSLAPGVTSGMQGTEVGVQSGLLQMPQKDFC